MDHVAAKKNPPHPKGLCKMARFLWRAQVGKNTYSLSDIMAEPNTLPGKPLKPCLLPEKDHVVLLHKRHEVTWC